MKSEEVGYKLAAASLNFFKYFVLQTETTCIYNVRESQIRTSRLIETLRFLLCISVSKKPFACAVFGIHRVKVLLCDNVFSLSAAHFLCRNCPKISVSIKKWNRKNLPRPFVSIVYPFVSTVRHFVSKVWFCAEIKF